MNEDRMKLAMVVKILKSNLKDLEFKHFENPLQSAQLAELRIRIEQLEHKVYPWKKFDKN